jgi:hypothetical protein
MPTPVENVKRDYAVYLRGPVGYNTFGFALTDSYRSGVHHLGLMSAIPAAVDNMADDFGIMVGGGFMVEIADEDGTADWYLLQENDAGRILMEDGSGYLIMERP